MNGDTVHAQTTDTATDSRIERENVHTSDMVKEVLKKNNISGKELKIQTRINDVGSGNNTVNGDGGPAGVHGVLIVAHDVTSVK